MIEREKKMMLSNREYCLLKQQWFVNGNHFLQVNRYYDTSDGMLRSREITCRIREKNKRCVATIKNHRIDQKEASMEYSLPVRGLWDDSIFRVIGLSCQGTLTTERIVRTVTEGVKMMLDENQYLGVVDYELEVEYTARKEKEAVEALEQMFNYLFINGLTPDLAACRERVCAGLSKSERFFEKKYNNFCSNAMCSYDT